MSIDEAVRGLWKEYSGVKGTSKEYKAFKKAVEKAVKAVNPKKGGGNVGGGNQ